MKNYKDFPFEECKLLQIALQYTLPRVKQATNELSEDLTSRLQNAVSTHLQNKFLNLKIGYSNNFKTIGFIKKTTQANV